MAKVGDPFGGGRTYYGPSLRRDDMPDPAPGSATGMQANPTTRASPGMWYKEQAGTRGTPEEPPAVVCSLGDASHHRGGRVAEAFQMAC